MAWIKCALPERYASRTSTVPTVRLMDNKGGRKLFLSAPAMEASGLRKGDGLVLEHDDEHEGMYRVRRIEDGEHAFCMLSQGKNERHGVFTTAGSLLVMAGYHPGHVVGECGPGYIVFDAKGLTVGEVKKPTDSPEATKALKPWPLTIQPKTALHIVRSLVANMPDEAVRKECMVRLDEIQAVRAFVKQSTLATVRTRSKPGQELWFKQTEDLWARTYDPSKPKR